MSHCVNCETQPVVSLNGEGRCAHHAEQEADFNARLAPPIAFAPRVHIHPQSGASTSGTPRHYK